MKFKTFSAITFFLLFFHSGLFSQDVVVGKWHAEDLDNSVIKIYKESNLLFGKIIASDKAEYIGQMVLKSFKYNQKDTRWEGTIYSPKRKMEINGTLSLESPDKIKLVGRKYLMTKTFYWNRLE